MKNTILVTKNYRKAQVDDRMFSSFLEHLGRAIYTGIYEPDHPTADENGFRMDVMKLIQDLNVEMIRYPGGNFVSGYNWEDGIGEKTKRPRRLDLAWRTIESNQFGLDEFVAWSKKAKTKIMAAVNMGTGTPQKAADMIEYCNFPSGTDWSNKRKANGYPDPHDIKLWCIGNEMDGPWQICHLDADDYGKKALETAKMLKWVDPSIELVVSGSSNWVMPTFPSWDRTVLEYTYDHVEFLSMHQYYENNGNDLDFLASFKNMDIFIKSVVATCDYVKALKRSKKTIYLSFDEWNVWYIKKMQLKDWEEAPEILEDRYSLLDALVFGGLITTLLNNADRVKIACLAQLVNVIGPIFTKKGGAAIKQTIFYPFKDFCTYGRGEVLIPISQVSKTNTIYGETEELPCSVIYNESKKEITVFLLNINQTTNHELDLNFASFGKLTMIEHNVLQGNDLNAINDFDNPDRVIPTNLNIIEGKENTFTIIVSSLSWNVIRFKEV